LARARICNVAVENTLRFLDGKPIRDNVVIREVLD
jgi:hypothetical protein